MRPENQESPVQPGEYVLAPEPVVCNDGRQTLTLEVLNRGDRPVQVGSHFHFAEANRALEFDREASLGFRLDIPAGTAVRLEPGDKRSVDLVAIGGDRAIYGFRDLVDGPLEDRTPAAFDAAEAGRTRPHRSASAAGDAAEALRERAAGDYSNETR